MVVKVSSQLLSAKFHNCRACGEVEKYIKIALIDIAKTGLTITL
jgi:hypothetical protein